MDFESHGALSHDVDDVVQSRVAGIEQGGIGSLEADAHGDVVEIQLAIQGATLVVHGDIREGAGAHVVPVGDSVHVAVLRAA